MTQSSAPTSLPPLDELLRLCEAAPRSDRDISIQSALLKHIIDARSFYDAFRQHGPALIERVRTAESFVADFDKGIVPRQWFDDAQAETDRLTRELEQARETIADHEEAIDGLRDNAASDADVAAHNRQAVEEHARRLEAELATLKPPQPMRAVVTDEWISDIIEMARDQRTDGGWELSVSEVIGNAKVGGLPTTLARSAVAPKGMPEQKDEIAKRIVDGLLAQESPKQMAEAICDLRAFCPGYAGEVARGMPEQRVSDAEVVRIKTCMDHSPNDVDDLCADLLAWRAAFRTSYAGAIEVVEGLRDGWRGIMPGSASEASYWDGHIVASDEIIDALRAAAEKGGAK